MRTRFFRRLLAFGALWSMSVSFSPALLAQGEDLSSPSPGPDITACSDDNVTRMFNETNDFYKRVSMAKAAQAKFAKAKSAKPKAVQAKSVQTKSAKPKDVQAKSVQAKSAKAKAAQANSENKKRKKPGPSAAFITAKRFEKEVDVLWSRQPNCSNPDKRGDLTHEKFEQYMDVVIREAYESAFLKMDARKPHDAKFYVMCYYSLQQAIHDEARAEGWTSWLAFESESLPRVNALRTRLCKMKAAYCLL